MTNMLAAEWKRDQFRRKGIRRCAYCRKPLTLKLATVDHRKPLAKGGKNAPDNFALACWPCNHEKGSKDVEPTPPVDPFAPDPWWPPSKCGGVEKPK
jgi:5-methylcytosine-specific restriction endonuclease McrA